MSAQHQAHVGNAHRAGPPLPGFGLPEERMARMAAQTAFSELKCSFVCATAEIEGGRGKLLQRQVLMASEAVELWRLQDAVFAALPVHCERSRMHKADLHQQLDSVFPDCGRINGFASR